MKSGTIKLLYKDKEVLVYAYRDRSERRGVVEKWRKMYGERFNKCAIQICPKVNHEAYNRTTGLNMRYRKEKVVRKRRSEKLITL